MGKSSHYRLQQEVNHEDDQAGDEAEGETGLPATLQRKGNAEQDHDHWRDRFGEAGLDFDTQGAGIVALCGKLVSTPEEFGQSHIRGVLPLLDEFIRALAQSNQLFRTPDKGKDLAVLLRKCPDLNIF